MTYSASYSPSMPIPMEPMVLGPVLVTRTTAELNVSVYVPWKNCKLAYAYAVTTTVVGTANFEIDLELNAASGTEIMSITLPTASSAVGDIAEATFSNASAGYNLDRDNADRDAINIEIGAHESGAAAAMVFMYFEPMN